VATSKTQAAAALTAGFSRGFTVAALIALAGAVAGCFVPRQARPSVAVAGAAPAPDAAPRLPVVEAEG
jgi:hypothetical protein